MDFKAIFNRENFFKKFTETISIHWVCKNLIWLVKLRWIASIGLLFGVLMSKAFFSIDAEAVFPPLFIGLLILFFNLLFHLRIIYWKKKEIKDTPKAIEQRLAFINIQILIDLILLTAIIYYTGGIRTPLLFFFIFHMVISSIMLSKLNAYFWAFFTIFIESLMTYFEYAGMLKHQAFFYFIKDPGDHSGHYELFVLTVFSITLLVTVYFATTIMRPIREKQLELTIIKNELEEQTNKLESKNIELEEMDRSKTAFLYRVEHELKAPIGAILGLLSVVSRGYETVDDRKKIDFINRSITRVNGMKQMVLDLLSLSRIEARNFKLKLSDIDLKALLDQILEDLDSYTRKKGIRIKTDIETELPAIQGDADAVQEILHNLVHNAIKYSFEGEVMVRFHKEESGIIFSVQDSGIGIDEADLQNIFEEFYRTSNAKAYEEGTGLGLSLVKKLVEQHGGSITIQSELNRGTECIVRFPITK